ncbi:hypothetical protein ACHAXH_009091 [Discostella pseudostelligera]
MPWQAAPSLIIIFGAFNVAAGLIWTVDRCYHGKRGRTTGHNQWTWAMEKRDERIEQMRALKK